MKNLILKMKIENDMEYIESVLAEAFLDLGDIDNADLEDLAKDLEAAAEKAKKIALFSAVGK